jgi:hypothetical protein
MTKQIDASKVQDAYHYALAACPGGVLGGYDSSFQGGNAEYSPSKYLRMAYLAAKEAGCDVKAPRALRDAPTLAEAIDLEARAGGVWAYGGCRLCPFCRATGTESQCGGLCHECFAKQSEAFKAPIKAALREYSDAHETLRNHPGDAARERVRLAWEALKATERAALGLSQ